MRVLAIFALLAVSLCAAQTAPPSPALQRLEQDTPAFIELQPMGPPRDIRVTGDARAVYTAIGAAFGIRMTFDEGLRSRSTSFLLEKTDFATAMDVASQVTRTFWIPRTAREVFVANDDAAKHREHDRVLLKTFYFPETIAPTELNDYANVFRSVLEMRNVQVQPTSRSIIVRAPYGAIVAAERLLASMDASRPQVALELQVYEINRSLLRAIGVDLPLQFQLFNIGGALAALGDNNVQDLINQLLQGGNLTPENAAAIAALLGQLQNQQSALLANPLATFGGGLTLFGVGVPPVRAQFLRQESKVQSLQKARLLAGHGSAATLHIGTRHPILTQSFSSGISIPGIDTQQTISAIPGFQYEDLGVSLKATPQVHGDSLITLNLEMSVKSLGSQRLNGSPIIQNREYKGVITVKNGEAAVMAAMVSQSESRAMRGLPGLSNIPVLGRLVSSQTVQEDDTELLLLMTPVITRTRQVVDDVIPFTSSR